MATASKSKASVTYTFAITFTAPSGMSIAQARAHIQASLIAGDVLGIKDTTEVKIHLTNKEVSYGKR